ncbi:MAG: hypothetical protein NTZ97_00200 [Candidatus Moranbacteria bacterium]|nr:hypothetical protein [Candidatus Moranbacteria bacterium]
MKKTIICVLGFLFLCFAYNYLASGDFEDFFLTAIFMLIGGFFVLICWAIAKSSNDKSGWVLLVIILTYLTLPLTLNFASWITARLGYLQTSIVIFKLRYASLLIVPLIGAVIGGAIDMYHMYQRMFRQKNALL